METSRGDFGFKGFGQIRKAEVWDGEAEWKSATAHPATIPRRYMYTMSEHHVLWHHHMARNATLPVQMEARIMLCK